MAQRRPNNAANNDQANKHHNSEDDAGVRWGAVTASGHDADSACQLLTGGSSGSSPPLPQPQVK